MRLLPNMEKKIACRVVRRSILPEGHEPTATIKWVYRCVFKPTTQKIGVAGNSSLSEPPEPYQKEQPQAGESHLLHLQYPPVTPSLCLVLLQGWAILSIRPGATHRVHSINRKREREREKKKKKTMASYRVTRFLFLVNVTPWLNPCPPTNPSAYYLHVLYMSKIGLGVSGLGVFFPPRLV